MITFKLKHLVLIFLACILLLPACKDEPQNAQKVVSQLEAGFKNPPLEARPRAYLDFVDGNFDKKQLTYELEQAKEKGMGGFEIWDVWHVVDEDNLVPAGPAFMSDEQVDGIVHAINEATRLGLDMGLIISSGWNAGGSWTTPENATMGLFQSREIINGPKSFAGKLAFPELPKDYGKYPCLIEKGDDGLPVFYNDVAVLAFPVSGDSLITATDKVINLTDKMQKDGSLTWEAPEGQWQIVRYVCTNTGQPMIAHSPNSIGPMIDHFSAEATETHLMYFINKLKAKLGSFDGKSFTHLYTDSYEVRGQLWTPLMLQEFKQRFGYDMTPYIPVLSGFMIENKNVTSRFLYDYRQLLSDLIIDNHYKKGVEVCKAHGLDFAAEAAGPGQPIHDCPFESLRSSGVLTFPRGEFWHRRTGKNADLVQVIKGVACASHLYDRTYVEAEAFTSTALWQEGLDELKPTADRAFCEGLNRIIFHTFPHTPKGKPGWVYAFGTLVNTTRIWWPFSETFMAYLGRTSYMLQQGNFVGDVLYYYGDSAPNFVPAKKIDPNHIWGYDYDYTNTDIILNKLDVKDGRWVLPHGQSYEVLSLPDEQYMNIEVLIKLMDLVEKGGTLIGPKPQRSHGLHNWQQRDQEVKTLADKLWGQCDGKTVMENSYGQGKVVWGKSVEQVLNDRGVGHDFKVVGAPNEQLDFIHRQTDKDDIYYVCNTTDKPLSVDALFRVTGRVPQIWHPVSGNVCRSVAWTTEENYTRVPLELDAYGSLFVVLVEADVQPVIESIKKDGQQIFPIKTETPIRSIAFQGDSVNSYILLSEVGTYEFINANGEARTFEVKGLSDKQNISGTWQFELVDGIGAPHETSFDKLISWTESADEKIKFFSGIGAYTNSFSLPKEAVNDSIGVFLNLGTVHEVAKVFINGKALPPSWVPPHRLDISPYVKAGENTISIQGANLWPNQMIADEKRPPEERKTFSNVRRMPNGWSHPLSKLPNDEYGLLPSGLLGPVTVQFVAKISIQ